MSDEQHRTEKTHCHGIDLTRGLASYNVVVAHSGFGLKVPMTPAADAFSGLTSFAVPFFLSTSLYFRADRTGQNSAELKDRLLRLFFPYLIWSAIYLLAHLGKLLVLRQGHLIPALLRSIPEHLLCGSAAVHLYFFPLLATGTVLVYILQPFLSRVPRTALVALLVVACAGAANFGAPVPFDTQGTLAQKTVWNLSSWTFRNLPIAVAALLLARIATRSSLLSLPPAVTIASGIAVIVPMVPGLRNIVPHGAGDVWIGFSWLLLAFGISRWLPRSKAFNVIGATATGIFLVHHLVIEAIQTSIELSVPEWASLTTLPWLLGISLAGYAISFSVVLLTTRHSVSARKVFAI
jgi:hypothetical protein